MAIERGDLNYDEATQKGESAAKERNKEV